MKQRVLKLARKTFNKIQGLRRRLGAKLAKPHPIELYLDIPTAETPICYPASLELKGWAFSSKATIRHIEVFRGNHLLGRLNYGFERQDVAQHLGIAAFYSGLSGSFC